MDPTDPLSLQTPTLTGMTTPSAPAYDLSPNELLARVLEAYPSQIYRGWRPSPPSMEDAAKAGPLMQLGLAYSYPDLFGHFGPNSLSSQLDGGAGQSGGTSAGPSPTAALQNGDSETLQNQLAGSPETSASPLGAATQSQPLRWTLPNGQTVSIDDTVEGPNVAYHHGSLGGVPGTFVDNPTDPANYQTIFTPSGLDPRQTYGFTPAPEISPSGEQYYDKVVWQAGNRQGFLRVDPQGRPIKAFALDTGEAKEAPISPFDFLGPVEAKLAADAVASAGKVAFRPLGEAFSQDFATSGIRAASDQSLKYLPEPALQLGGAYAKVRGAKGYVAHHMPAKAASLLSEREGPAIAMLPEDHFLTASWGPGKAPMAYRQQQADLIRAGRFKDAQQMDIDDIRKKFGSKYDDAIDQMIGYTDGQGYGR